MINRAFQACQIIKGDLKGNAWVTKKGMYINSIFADRICIPDRRRIFVGSILIEHHVLIAEKSMYFVHEY